MLRSALATTAILLINACANTPSPSMSASPMDLETFVEARAQEFERVPMERRQLLHDLAGHIAAALDTGGAARLTFICTHNSRRSQMGQIWAAIAARKAGIDGVDTYSGGTEVTAFNPRAVAALRRAGLHLREGSPADPFATHGRANRVYTVTGWGDGDALECWSKRFDDPSNPQADFIAVMTCSDADASCPFVPGASRRVALTYEDPKAFDGTTDEVHAYDERCEQIAREMLLLFHEVARRRP